MSCLFGTPEASPIECAGYNDRQARYVKFRRPCLFVVKSVLLYRQLTGETATDTPIPEVMQNAWVEACKQKSNKAKTALFNTFLKAGGDWSALLAHITK